MFNKYLFAAAFVALGSQAQAGVVMPVIETGTGDAAYVSFPSGSSLTSDFEWLDDATGNISNTFDLTWEDDGAGGQSFDSATFQSFNNDTFDIDEAVLSNFFIMSAMSFAATLTYSQSDRMIQDGASLIVTSDDFAFDLTGDQGEQGILSFFAPNATTSFGISYEIRGMVNPIPLPAGAVLLLTGLAGFGVMRRQKRAA